MGVSMMTNADGSYLGDSRFDPIFTELQRRAAVVFVYPTASPDPIAHTLSLPDSLLDYPVDTSRAIADSTTGTSSPERRTSIRICACRRDDPIPRLALCDRR
jgi:hypothetical protein